MATVVELVDRRIADLRATHELIAQNLVELDTDVTRQMLDRSTSLAGRTAEEWEAAQERLSSLWQGQLALADLLDRVVVARGTKSSAPRASLVRLSELLDGPSVSVARSGARRSLTEGTAPTDQLTLDVVIARMSADYDAVVAVVNEVAAVWTVTAPRLGALTATVTELESAADASGDRRPDELARARQALVQAEELAQRDPLSVPEDVLSAISALADRAAAAIRASGVARQALVDELDGVGAAIADCRHGLAQAAAAWAAVAEKVRPPESVHSDLAEATAELARLEVGLADARRLAETSPAAARDDLGELARQTAELHARSHRLASTEGADLASRDELRGRLEAFRAKAQALGRGEDLELDQLYGEAQDVLYDAPCDLDRARALVLAYQRSVGSRGRGAS